MNEESELKNQPDEIDLDKNSKNFRNLDRPTPPVEAKTAEEIIKLLEEDARHYKQYGDHVEHRTVNECISKIKRFLPVTPSAKSVEVEEANPSAQDQAIIKVDNMPNIHKQLPEKAYIFGFIDGANWQEQKQAETISRMQESIYELEGYLTISNTSREFNKNKAKGLGEALRKILRTPSKSDCDLIAKEALKEK